MSDSTVNLNKIPYATFLFTAAQAINLTAAVVSVTIAALVGAKLAPSNGLATLPYGVQFLFVLLLTYPASMLMERKGRLLGFRLGAVMLLISGVLGYIAVSFSNYYLLIVSHAFLGAYVACANFYRFAAVDNISVNMKSKAMSLVIAGGLVAAIFGPLVSIFLRDVSGFVEFSLCYAFFCILAVLTLVILNNKVVRNSGGANNRVVEKEKRETFQRSMSINTAVLSIAVFSASAGYFIMNLLMIQSSLVMKDIHSFNHSSFAIQAHVFSMFFPSLFSGVLIKRMGAFKVIMIGYVLLMACSLIAVLYPPNYNWMFLGLILLGLGWNFTYVGGGALLAEKAIENQRFAWQGVNDTLIAAFATVGAFSPSILLQLFGWAGSNWFTLVLSFGAFLFVGLFFIKSRLYLNKKVLF